MEWGLPKVEWVDYEKIPEQVKVVERISEDEVWLAAAAQTAVEFEQSAFILRTGGSVHWRW